MTLNSGPCITFALLPPLPQLPTPLDFSFSVGISFPPPPILELINNGIPCCKFNFTPFVFALPIPIPLTPIVIAINAAIKAVYVAMLAEAAAAGIPSTINLPSCPWILSTVDVYELGDAHNAVSFHENQWEKFNGPEF